MLQDPLSAETNAERVATRQRTVRVILAVTLIGLGLFVSAGISECARLGDHSRHRHLAALRKVRRPAVLLRRRNLLAPLLFTFLIALVFVVPLAFAAVEIGRELNGLAGWVSEAQRTGTLAVPDWLPKLPLVGDAANGWWRDNLAEPGAVADLMGRANSGTLARLTQQVGLIVARRLTLFAFTILTLFFLFRDGVKLRQRFLILTDRVLGKPGPHLAQLMVTAVRSTADGLVLVGLGEGALLGVAYAILGVPHPALFGAFTGLLAMIPFGAPVFFVAAALLLLVNGSTGAAIGLVVFGFLVVFVADHFIRPVLIGGAAKLPFLWVLLGIFGGITTFGLLGLFVGPAIMAALVSLWREWTAPGSRATAD